MPIVEGDISKLKADARGTDTKLKQMEEIFRNCLIKKWRT